MSKGGKSRARSPEQRHKTRAWTDQTIQAILDAAPSETARGVLLTNPTMMKALIRKAARHTDDDGVVDVAILKRILAEDDGGAAGMRDAIRDREERLQAEMQRAAEAETRLQEAQAKLTALALEKVRVSSVAEQAREEAKLIKLSLDMVSRDIERRNQEMKRLEDDYDELNAEAARVRSENRKLKLKEAHEAGRAAGRAEGRTYGVREGARRAFDEGYGEGYELGFKDTMERIQKGAALQLSQDPEPEPLPEPVYEPIESSQDTQAAPVTAAYRNIPDAGVQRQNSDRERDRLAARRQQQLQNQAQARSMPEPDPAPQMPIPEPFVPPQRTRSPNPSIISSLRNSMRHGPPPPTEAEQIRDEYQSPNYKAPIPIHNSASPRPHSIKNPLPDVFMPTMENGTFTVPAAHEWNKTPAASFQELQGSPRPSPRSSRNALPFVPPQPPKTPKATASSIRSSREREREREREYEMEHRRSPTQSTPLSQYSILQSDEMGVPPQAPAPPPLHAYRARNNSQLSVIPEQSDYDGASPVVTGRMNSMSPARRGPQYNGAPMNPNVSYAPAPDPVRSGGSGIDMPIPSSGHYVDSQRMGMPEPTPGQPRLRQYEQETIERPISPMIPNVNVSYAVAPEASENSISNLSARGSKKQKKGKPQRGSSMSNSQQSMPVPEIQIQPPPTNQKTFSDRLRLTFSRKNNPILA